MSLESFVENLAETFEIEDTIAEIIPGKLYLGSAISYERLKEAKMRSILNIAGMHYDGNRICYPLNHFAGKTDIKNILKLLRILITCGKAPVYIHCMNGMNRSPMICALYLFKYHRDLYPIFEDALAWVKKQRPQTSIIDQNLDRAKDIVRELKGGMK